MDQNQAREALREITRLAAGFQTGLNEDTMVEYTRALLRGDTWHLRAAVDQIIDHDAEFPSVARIKRVMDNIERGVRVEKQERALVAQVGTVTCLRCGDAGYLRYDVPVGHEHFGKMIVCPDCNGESNVHVQSHAAMRFHLAREHERHPWPEGRELPERRRATPPPEHFASPRVDLIPKTDAEDAQGRARAQMAQHIAAIAKRWRQHERGVAATTEDDTGTGESLSAAHRGDDSPLRERTGSDRDDAS